MRVILITEFGGPEVLTVADVPAPEPGSGQHLIQVARAGVNYGDTHQAEDSYLAKGGTGYGVRTLVEFVSNWKKPARAGRA